MFLLEPLQEDMQCRVQMSEGAIQLCMPGLSNVSVVWSIISKMVPIIDVAQPEELEVANEMKDQQMDLGILHWKQWTGVRQQSVPSSLHALQDLY